MHDMMLFSGNANSSLSEEVAQILDLPLGKATTSHFSDGEQMIEILENVRGNDVFIIQSTCQPCDTNLMELILLSDAIRRASAVRISAIIPYFGYARQDRRVRSARVPISAKVVADMLASVGINRVLTVDLHADQIQGFFQMPVDNAYASSVFLEDIIQQDFPNLMLVSPDVGGVVRARAYAKRLNDADLAIIDKRRPLPNEAKVMNIIGRVKNRDCVLVDDLVDTAGTLCQAADALKQDGANRVVAYCTHPVLSGAAIQNIEAADALDELVVSNTIPLSLEAQSCSKIRVVSLASMLAEVVRRIKNNQSISSLFD